MKNMMPVVKRTYKKRGTKQTMDQRVRRIAKAVVARNIETKWYTQTQGLTFGYQTGVLQLLNNIPQNVGLTSRIGCKVHLKSVRLTGVVAVVAPTTDFARAWARVMVVTSTQPLAAADIATQVQGPRQHNVYKVLYDEQINFDVNKLSVPFMCDVPLNKFVKYADALSVPEDLYVYAFYLGSQVAGTTTIAGYNQLTGYQMYFKDA